MEENKIPLMDCPVDYLIGDASGKIMNEYGKFPCKIMCGVYALLVRGHARASIDITEYVFQKNDVLLLEPGSFFLIHEFSEDALVYYVLFSSAFLERNTFGSRMSLDAMQLRNPIVSISDEHAKVICGMVELLMAASNCKIPMLNTDKMVHIFNLLQSAYSSYAKKQDNYLLKPQDRRTAIYQEYTRLILDKYTEWHHVKEYAEAMHITLPHLCSTIKSVCNKTAGDLINEAIVTDAKAQLKLSTLQVKEIALSLGFENVAFFNRFFKMHTGVTPKTYRHQS